MAVYTAPKRNFRAGSDQPWSVSTALISSSSKKYCEPAVCQAANSSPSKQNGPGLFISLSLSSPPSFISPSLRFLFSFSFFSLSCFLSIPAQPATLGLGSLGSICPTPGPHHGMAWCWDVCAQREAMSPTAAHRLGSLHPGLGGFQPRGKLEESGLPPLLFGLSAFRMSPSSSQKPSGMARGSGWAFCC